VSKSKRALALVTAVSALVFSVAACGSGSSGAAAPTSAASSSAGAPASSSAVADYATILKEATDGLVPPLPDSSPKPEAGKKVWVVSCGQQAASCATISDSAKKAAAAIGWTASVCDGKLSPQSWGDCIRQGTAAKVDGILTVSVDCVVVTEPLKEAAAAGVKTISVGGTDCTETGGAQTYTAVAQWTPDQTSLLSWYEGVGHTAAKYAIGKQEGKANVLLLNFKDAVWGPSVTKGFKDELATCSGCTIAKTLDLGNNDLTGGTLASKFSTALLQSKDANAVFVPIDIWLVLGLAEGISSSGRPLTVVGAFGDAANMDLVRAGKETASVNNDPVHMGYAGIDTAIRVFAGQPAVSEGVGYQAVDKDNNLPAKGPYREPRTIEDTYLKLWGIG